MPKTKVLIVDDSALMRRLIKNVLEKDPELLVVGQASDPLSARQMIKETNPDVLTLDIEMPNMNGLEFLDKVMRLRPMPVVMVSTLTQAGAAASIRALELGAYDCVGKPTAENPGSLASLASTVRMAARARIGISRSISRASERPVAHPLPTSDQTYRYNLIAIGASTGGVEALSTVLRDFPADCPPTIITQHMSALFTRSFAERLNKSCAPRVSEAKDGDKLSSGRIYLAPGGSQHLEIAKGPQLCCRLRSGELVNGHRPSVDILFNSVAKIAPRGALGIILTGMGGDGAMGLKAMKAAGASTIGQDKATSIIYGMPKVAFELSAVDVQLPITDISAAALSTMKRKTPAKGLSYVHERTA